jgi:hypothetical protein
MSVRYSIRKTLFTYGYEVAPEWRAFCTFGPEDIGTVWEEIGAIRPIRFDKWVLEQAKRDVDREILSVFDRLCRCEHRKGSNENER